MEFKAWLGDWLIDFRWRWMASHTSLDIHAVGKIALESRRQCCGGRSQWPTLNSNEIFQYKTRFREVNACISSICKYVRILLRGQSWFIKAKIPSTKYCVSDAHRNKKYVIFSRKFISDVVGYLVHFAPNLLCSESTPAADILTRWLTSHTIVLSSEPGFFNP